MYPPENFDANEWFFIISFVAIILLIMKLKPIFPRSLAIIILLYCAMFAHVIDHFLASPPLDLYDVNDSEKFEIFDELIYFLYAPWGYLFVYLYERWKLKNGKALVYILVWTLFGVGYEYFAAYLHVFEYKGWKPYYSLPFYLIVQGLTIWIYTVLKKSLERSDTITLLSLRSNTTKN